MYICSIYIICGWKRRTPAVSPLVQRVFLSTDKEDVNRALKLYTPTMPHFSFWFTHLAKRKNRLNNDVFKHDQNRRTDF